jgi:DNA-binding MarR family transcriptional regulator
MPRLAPDTGVDEESRDLLQVLDRLVRAYQFRDRQRVCYRGLSINECYALQAVVRTKGMTQNQLATALNLDKSTTSRLLDSLQRQGCLIREADPCDGRAHRLRASEKGRRLYGVIQGDLLRRHHRLLSDLSSDVRRAAILVMARLADDAAQRFHSED